MPSFGELRGQVSLRPVRSAIRFPRSVSTMRRAIQWATSSWGGKHYLLHGGGDFARFMRLAARANVDILQSAADEPTDLMPGITGFKWRGRGPYGPFANPQTGTGVRVLGPELFTGLRDPSSLAAPAWHLADPLGDLFAAWFGCHGTTEFDRELQDRFNGAAHQVSIPLNGEIPDLIQEVTPIELTATDIAAVGGYSPAGFHVIDPGDALGIVDFWNLRALGCDVLPWPVGSEDRISGLAIQWLRNLLESGGLTHLRSGSGEDRGLALRCWTGEGVPPPEALERICRQLDIRILAEPGDSYLHTPHEYSLQTHHSKNFLANFSAPHQSVTVTLPPFASARTVSQVGYRGIVAAEVHIYTESGAKTGMTHTIPPLRKLSDLIPDAIDHENTFCRTGEDGFVFGVPIDLDGVDIPAVSSSAVFSQILHESSYQVSQSDAGKLSTRLVELLGGVGTTAGNQPAIRAVLHKSATTPKGRALVELVGTAKKHRGSWPGPVNAAAMENYPKNLVNYLLQRKILRPVLPVKCPECTTDTVLRPEDLSNEITCEMCSAMFPLGLSLALTRRRSDWLYRLAGNLSPSDIAGTLPVMACLNILTECQFASTGVHHVLGLELSRPGHKCEIDIAWMADYDGQPVVIIGEVKSYLGSIDTNDIRNLARVQAEIRKSGVECFILAATLREELAAEEVGALRGLFQSPPTLHHRGTTNPVFPIVLTATELSVHGFNERHPLMWNSGDVRGVVGLAIESCKKNLGLAGYEAGGSPEVPWQARWTGTPAC